MCYRIKLHAPPARFSKLPIILNFSLATVVLRWIAYQFLFDTFYASCNHRLLLELPGYLILFAPQAFMPQRQ